MATQAYKDYAPTLNEAGVTKAYCDGVEVATKSTGGSTPEITKAKAEAAIAKFADIEKSNGYVQIAQDVGLTTNQVKKLHREFLLTKNPPEKVEKPVEEPVEE
jgi:hypothetical protein